MTRQTIEHLGRQKLEHSGVRAAALHALENDATNNGTMTYKSQIKLIDMKIGGKMGMSGLTGGQDHGAASHKLSLCK